MKSLKRQKLVVGRRVDFILINTVNYPPAIPWPRFPVFEVGNFTPKGLERLPKHEDPSKYLTPDRVSVRPSRPTVKVLRLNEDRGEIKQV